MLQNKKWLALILIMVFLGTVAVGAATASTSTASSQGPYHGFLGNLAHTLGISQGTLTADWQQAYTLTVDQEVYSGKITKQQADKILARIGNGRPFFGFRGIDFGKGRSVAGAVYGKRGPWMGRNHRAMGGFMIVKPLAGALGMNQKDLMSALRSGQTISALATAKGTNVTALQGMILSSIQSQLTSMVQSGKLTPTRETQIYNKLQEYINSGNWVTQLQKICQPRNHGQQSAN